MRIIIGLINLNLIGAIEHLVQGPRFLRYFATVTISSGARSQSLAVVVSQFVVEQSLPTPEIRGSNPAISNFNFINCF